MKLSPFPMVEGKFIERPNRFIARVMLWDNGKEREIKAHVANTGRMQELLIPGARVRMAYRPAPNRKTDYTLLTVYHKRSWVCIHSTMANTLAFEYLSGFSEYQDLRREVSYEKSRFDLAFSKEGKPGLYEVKSANLVIGSKAMFPDAPTERGRKHLVELMQAHRKGYITGVLFIVQREDAEFFTPNIQTDPEFAALLKEAVAMGVSVCALRCLVEEETIAILGEIPVCFDDEPDEAIIERILF